MHYTRLLSAMLLALTLPFVPGCKENEQPKEEQQAEEPQDTSLPGAKVSAEQDEEEAQLEGEESAEEEVPANKNADAGLDDAKAMDKAIESDVLPKAKEAREFFGKADAEAQASKALVEDLYKSGAQKVLVEVDDTSGESMATMIVIELPSDSSARKQVLSTLNAKVGELEINAVEDVGQRFVSFYPQE